MTVLAAIPPARRRAIGLLALAALLLAFPYIHDDDGDIDSAANAMSYAILALGLNIVVGYAGLLDLGYAAFFAIGSYTHALLASPQFGLHLFFWLLLPIASLVAAFFGMLLGAPTLRLRGDYLAIVTLGFGEIVPTFLVNLDAVTGGANGISGIDQPALGGF